MQAVHVQAQDSSQQAVSLQVPYPVVGLDTPAGPPMRLLKVCSVPPPRSLMKRVNSVGPRALKVTAHK